MKVKMFTKMNPKNRIEPTQTEYETEVNAWLENNPGVEIRHILQSAGAGSLGPFLFFITVWYEGPK